ncbi:MAG TPA: hypothetical protein VJZ50_12070, partial [Candidatus Limnocylindrales bacterium]|nr:hypothetical protein [Candidatus Limnocylindrales bacterium]
DRSGGVSRVFEAAAEAGIPTLVLQGSIPSGTTYDPVATALIDEALQAGDAVIVPAEPVAVAGRDRLGWWRVDPVTGAAADTMDDGSASQFTEESILVRMALCSAAFAPAYFSLLWAILDGSASKAAGVFASLYTGFWIWNAADLPAVVAACRGIPVAPL